MNPYGYVLGDGLIYYSLQDVSLIKISHGNTSHYIRDIHIKSNFPKRRKSLPY